jgi:NADH dehydrogenase
MTNPSKSQVQILIVGGGFGGVRAAQRLARHRELSVTLISSDDTFAYYPQLYHAATGGARTESAIPLAELLGHRGVTIVKDTITTLDPVRQTVGGQTGQVYHYDKLVLALGSVTNYFGIKGLEEFAYNIKSITGAEQFKRHLHQQLVEDKQPDLNYVVVGGGPTGVELAAALGRYLQRITKIHGLGQPKYQVELIEAAPRILPRSPEAMSSRVQRRLEDLGVKVMTGAAVQAETADALQVSGQLITSKTVVWTAGMANNPFFKGNAKYFTLAKNGKVLVDQHLQGPEDVYVIGDNASTPYSGMAQTALSDADYAAADITRSVRGRRRRPYHPQAAVSVIPVGHNWAAVQWGPLRFYGVAGSVLRRLADLVGYADIESWPRALWIWLQESRHEDNCPICS